VPIDSDISNATLSRLGKETGAFSLETRKELVINKGIKITTKNDRYIRIVVENEEKP